MNIQKGLLFYLTLFFVLSLVLSPHGRVAAFVHSLMGYFWSETYFSLKDWNLILLCIIVAFVIRALKGGSNGKTSDH